jgi:hypothetical protein
MLLQTEGDMGQKNQYCQREGLDFYTTTPYFRSSSDFIQWDLGIGKLEWTMKTYLLKGAIYSEWIKLASWTYIKTKICCLVLLCACMITHYIDARCSTPGQRFKNLHAIALIEKHSMAYGWINIVCAPSFSLNMSSAVLAWWPEDRVMVWDRSNRENQKKLTPSFIELK